MLKIIVYNYKKYGIIADLPFGGIFFLIIEIMRAIQTKN